LLNMMGVLMVGTQPASTPSIAPPTTPANVPIQMLWKPGGGAPNAFTTGTAFGSATQGQEAWVNFWNMPTLSGGTPLGGWPVVSLLLRVQGTQGNPGAHLRVTYDRRAQTITVVDSFPGGGTTVFSGVTLNNGDSLVARSLPGNVLQVLAVSTTSVTLLGTATTPGSDVAGAIGLATDGNFGLTPTPSRSFTLDAFGGGTLL